DFGKDRTKKSVSVIYNTSICFFFCKRTISEVQLMHNVQEHKQVSQRQDWLQAKLRDITVPTHDKGQHHGQTRKIRDIFQHLYGSIKSQTGLQYINIQLKIIHLYEYFLK
uniref:Parathyroid hormone n=1 Tax=Gadus morhua TaxID=8049 RepID=A0A8C5FK30_GADMO